MKKMLFLLFVSLCFISSLAFGEDSINDKQPISVGEIVFRSQAPVDSSGVKGDVFFTLFAYRYKGLSNNTIKIYFTNETYDYRKETLELSFRYPNRVKTIRINEEDNFEIPLNNKKQALLKVRTRDKNINTRELLITVVDDFGRIRAEEYKNH
jgi:hypothetical protein